MITDHETIVERLTELNHDWYGVQLVNGDGWYGWTLEVNDPFGHRHEIIMQTRGSGEKHLYVDGRGGDTRVWRDDGDDSGVADARDGVNVASIEQVDHTEMFA